MVIRGQFAGRPVLGVMECKDHNKRLGPGLVEAFAKKSENLGANLRIMISKKGFTQSALKVAKHENIGCLSLLPDDPIQAGFSIGDMWYAVIQTWENIRLIIKYSVSPAPIKTFNPNNVKLQGKPVGLWFLKELIDVHGEEQKEGAYVLEVKFQNEQKIEINSQEYFAVGLACDATRICRKKKKWVCWRGDAFYDWHVGKFTVPPGGTLAGSTVDADVLAWSDYDGEIPKIGEGPGIGLIQGVFRLSQKWDKSLAADVPDLNSIGITSYEIKS